MADFNEYKGVWVFCEQRQGALMSTDFELVSEARKLADELGCEVTGLLLGDNVDGIAKELGGYGADKVMVCDSPLLKDYTTDAYAKVVCDMVNEYKPEVLLIGATNIGRDLGPRCAARLHTGPFVRFEKVPFPMEEILFDPQTSGGLLFAVAPQDAAALEAELQAAGLPAKIVGTIGEKQTPEITVTYE